MIPISIIVAVANNGVIGKDNQLLWYIPEDLKRFKSITTGHPVIMGRKTWESLKIKPLPNRRNIVITHSTYIVPTGVYIAHSVEEALKLCDPAHENFVIGGETIYRAFLAVANTIYYTKVEADFEGDTHFPELDNSWKLIKEEPGISEKALPFKFSYFTYKKI